MRMEKVYVKRLVAACKNHGIDFKKYYREVVSRLRDEIEWKDNSWRSPKEYNYILPHLTLLAEQGVFPSVVYRNLLHHIHNFQSSGIERQYIAEYLVNLRKAGHPTAFAIEEALPAACRSFYFDKDVYLGESLRIPNFLALRDVRSCFYLHKFIPEAFAFDLISMVDQGRQFVAFNKDVLPRLDVFISEGYANGLTSNEIKALLKVILRTACDPSFSFDGVTECGGLKFILFALSLKGPKVPQVLEQRVKFAAGQLKPLLPFNPASYDSETAAKELQHIETESVVEYECHGAGCFHRIFYLGTGRPIIIAEQKFFYDGTPEYISINRKDIYEFLRRFAPSIVSWFEGPYASPL